MGAFGGLQITNKGRALQAKAQTGAQLNFNRIAVGDGNLSGQIIADLNGLISEKKSLAITKLKTQPGGKAVVGAILSNEDVTIGFYFREIGVFAEDPDIGEILYCYGNAGASAEYIPAGGGPDIIEKHIDVVTIVGTASNITATIEQSLVFVTTQELDDHKTAAVLDHPDGSVTNAKLAPDSVTADKIAAGAVGTTELANNAATDTIIGNRTIDQATPTAYSNTGTLTQILSWFAKVIKGITGKANWYDAPTKTLEQLNTEKANLSSANFTVLQVGGNSVLHTGNHNSTGDPHTQYLQKTGGTLSGGLVMGDNIISGIKDIRLTNGTRLSETAGQRTALNAESDRFDVISESGTYYVLSAKMGTASLEFMRFDLLGANKVVRSGKDANGKFTQVDYYRADGTTRFQRTVLSGTPDTNGNYPTLTITRYADDGVTVANTLVYTITYDADGDYTQIT
ncbi:phage tail protein [Brevibacillus sp. H7]|uniref:phage tail-collar fiber domain-containing protein n=1 Tax=Brevibacillus sp. H7 TaxID=3349138 RepID=UPI0038162E9D